MIFWRQRVLRRAMVTARTWYMLFSSRSSIRVASVRRRRKRLHSHQLVQKGPSTELVPRSRFHAATSRFFRRAGRPETLASQQSGCRIQIPLSCGSLWEARALALRGLSNTALSLRFNSAVIQHSEQLPRAPRAGGRRSPALPRRNESHHIIKLIEAAVCIINFVKSELS